MVEGGQLRLAAGCRAALPGFYDPAPEEDKALYLLYTFRVLYTCFTPVLALHLPGVPLGPPKRRRPAPKQHRRHLARGWDARMGR